MLGQCKAMNLSQDSKLAELLSSIDFLKSQLVEIRSENTNLRNEIATLNDRIQVLENSTDGSSNMPHLIQELANREMCARNIIVHGLQESSSNDPTVRIASDIKLLDDNIHPCNLTLPQDLKLFRLGRKISGKPRPLKVVLSSTEMALSFVSVFNSHKRNQLVPSNSISISRDRTLLERQEIRRVYAELENRKKNGEHNISISIFRCDRSIHSSNFSRGGGVLIAVRNNLRPQLIHTGVQNVEQLFVRISVTNELSALISVVYIPPNANLSLYDAYTKSVDLTWESSNCDLGLFCGDFNLPGTSWSSTNQGLMFSGTINDKSSLIGDQFISMDFLQLNSIHNSSGSLLDLIFSDKKNISVEVAPVSLVPCDSYHPALSFNYQVPVPLIMLDDSHSFRDFNNADFDSIATALADNDWSTTFIIQPADLSATRLQESILDAIQRFVPLKSFRSSTFPSWVSPVLKSLLFKKKSAHKKFKITGSFHDYNLFSNLRSQCKALSKSCLKTHINVAQSRLASSPRDFWSFINKRRDSSSIPNQVYLNDISANGPDVAQLFSSFFASTYKQPSAAPNLALMNIEIQQFSFLPSHLSISIEEVSDALKTFSNVRGVGPDDIPASLLFKCREVLCSPLCTIFNKSLTEGFFPAVWKISRITPILKSGDPTLVTNYRPISNLPFIGKLFELIVLKQIERSLHSTLSMDQHGFFPGRSTITSSLDFSCFIRDAFRDNSQVDAIFTDFSKAFDSVDHNSLIYTLDKLGIGIPLLSWIRSYLVDRWQYVKLFNISSSKFKVSSGVPQGGHLSPLLFNIFVNSIFSNVPSVRLLLFADDAKLFSRISSSTDCDVLQSSFNNFINWCQAIGLTLNFDKCKIISFSRSRIPVDHVYTYNDSPLTRVSEVKDLGIIYTSSLSFRPHIDYITCKALRLLGFIRRHTKHFNSAPCIITLYSALIRSILDYGSAIWNPHLITETKLIERVQNRFLSYAGFLLKIEHPQHSYQPVMSALNLLSLKDRRLIVDRIFLLKLIQGKIDAPRLLERISLRVPTVNTRSTDSFHIPTSRSNFLSNDPLVRAMRNLNNNNFDIWP
ncbi:hypothetical protein QTP88_010604 [Uroleucon formosanum]